MTAMWFGLAAIALAGAVALLYLDHLQRRRVGHVRENWAKGHGYGYLAVDSELPGTWSRAIFAKDDFPSVVDVVSGKRRGEQFHLFDLPETATVVAVHRQVGSDVDLDLRLRSIPAPRDPDLELVGGIGNRIVFATDLEIARRVVDQRMAVYAETIPADLQLLWSEGEWTLGTLPISSTGRSWEAAIDAVARLSGLLHVLPPTHEPDGLAANHDPGRPFPPVARTVAAPPNTGAHAQPRPGFRPAPVPEATGAHRPTPPPRVRPPQPHPVVVRTDEGPAPQM